MRLPRVHGSRAGCAAKKILIALIAAPFALLLFCLPAAAGEKVIYDRDYNLRYRIDDSGRIYDRNYNRKGTIKDGKVYDRDCSLKYRIDGDRVYDSSYDLKYRRDGNRIYDKGYNLKGRIEER